jgi:hypothetical protein
MSDVFFVMSNGKTYRYETRFEFDQAGSLALTGLSVMGEGYYHSIPIERGVIQWQWENEFYSHSPQTPPDVRTEIDRFIRLAAFW